MTVESPMPLGYEDLRVRDLYVWDDNGRHWNVAVLSLLFVQEEVDETLSIPLTETVGNDELIWWKNKDGVYTVKGGYWVAMEDQVEQVKAQQLGPSIWNHIWRVNLRGVVKDFLWRVCRNVIPRVRQN